MTRSRFSFLSIALLAAATLLNSQTTQPPPARAPQRAPSPTKAAPAPAAMTNQDVIKLVQAKLNDDLILSKIKSSKTRFDTSVDGIVALKTAGVSDAVIAVMIDPNAKPAPAPPPAPAPIATPPPPTPASNSTRTVAATPTGIAPRGTPRPAEISTAPPNYGVYIYNHGELKPLGREQTKVQISKFRSLLHSIPFVRQRIDINLPGAHSTSRFEETRPTFFAYFPPSRDVSKFKLLQCKITGQKFDQRTVANASILFSTEQNQDEVPIDVGPTSVKDLYRLFPREDIPSGEFGFVEGNTGSKSASNIEILDVYDFAIERKEDKMSVTDYLMTLPPVKLDDSSFLEWSREDCVKIVNDRNGKVGLTGSLINWFKGQYSSIDVFWADAQFARAFARLEMLDRPLDGENASKLANLLLSPDGSYYILVAIGGKLGSGKLIGANEGERVMRPFDASLSDEKSKVVAPAKRLDFIGGYAGLWKVAFDEKSVRGPLLDSNTIEIIFEARLNQNLELKAHFPSSRLNPPASAAGDMY